MAPATIDRAEFAIFVQLNDFYHIDFRADPTDADSLILPRVATIIQRLRSQYQDHRVFFCLPGDFLNPSCLSRTHRSKQIIDLLNVMGLRLAVFGNHEFDLDKDHFTADDLLARFSESNFTWLLSNLKPEGTLGPKFLSQKPRSTDVVGIELSPQHHIVLFGFLYQSSYKDVAHSGHPVEHVAHFEDPVERCSRLIELTKNRFRDQQGAFRPARVTFVALTHQLVADDLELARRCPDLRLIMGGHDHEELKKVQHKDTGSLIVKAKSNARTVRLNFVVWLPRDNVVRFEQNFGTFEKAFQEQIGRTIIIAAQNVALTGHPHVPDSVNRQDPDIRGYLKLLTDRVAFDSPGVVARQYKDDGCAVVASLVFDTMHPGFRKLVDAERATQDRIHYWLDRSPEHREVLVRAPIDLETDDEGSRSRSTNFGNFVADVLAGRARQRNPGRKVADIGFVNGGSFRLNRNIPKGEAITKSVVCDLLFHSNDVRFFPLSGDTVERIVRRSFEELRGQGNFLQVSGLEVKVESGRIKEIFQVDDQGTRYSLDPARSYLVATTTYVATRDEAYGPLFAACDPNGKKGEMVEPSIRSAVEEELKAQAPDLAADPSLRWNLV
jgi:2',3'-cyclic-nucleotide 2'-phosphodiesterase (5'-nucleotidase family)